MQLNAQLAEAVKFSSHRDQSTLQRSIIAHSQCTKIIINCGLGLSERATSFVLAICLLLKKHPDVEIVAVSNSTYESSEKFCQEYSPSATPMRNWPELLALPDIDIIWIGTPPVMHSAVTVLGA